MRSHRTPDSVFGGQGWGQRAALEAMPRPRPRQGPLEGQFGQGGMNLPSATRLIFVPSGCSPHIKSLCSVEGRMPRSLLFTVSLLVSVAACDESRSVAPPGGSTTSGPELGTGNGPVPPGHSFVVRSNDGIFLTSVDDVNGLVVRHY